MNFLAHIFFAVGTLEIYLGWGHGLPYYLSTRVEGIMIGALGVVVILIAFAIRTPEGENKRVR